MDAVKVKAGLPSLKMNRFFTHSQGFGKPPSVLVIFNRTHLDSGPGWDDKLPQFQVKYFSMQNEKVGCIPGSARPVLSRKGGWRRAAPMDFPASSVIQLM